MAARLDKIELGTMQGIYQTERYLESRNVDPIDLAFFGSYERFHFCIDHAREAATVGSLRAQKSVPMLYQEAVAEQLTLEELSQHVSLPERITKLILDNVNSTLSDATSCLAYNLDSSGNVRLPKRKKLPINYLSEETTK